MNGNGLAPAPLPSWVACPLLHALPPPSLRIVYFPAAALNSNQSTQWHPPPEAATPENKLTH